MLPRDSDGRAINAQASLNDSGLLNRIAAIPQMFLTDHRATTITVVTAVKQFRDDNRDAAVSRR